MLICCYNAARNDPYKGHHHPGYTPLAKVEDGALNLSTSTVTAPVADSYYWRVDSYLDGSATGTPVTGNIFVFHVIDTDGG